MEEVYRLTDEGWAIAKDIYKRFVNDKEDINSIADSYGIEVDAVAALMHIALSGGEQVIDDSE